MGVKMNKIKYRYTNIAKQVFIIMCFIYVVLRFIIIIQIAVFKIKGYYDTLNIPLTIILYLVLLCFIAFVFLGYKLFYSTYDDNRFSYHNRLLKKDKTIEFDKVKTIIFDTFGIYFYDHDTTERTKKDATLFMPFFRNGVIEALQVDKFFRVMRERGDIRVIKKFRILPGYSKKWTWVAVLYVLLCIFIFINFTTPLTLIIVLFQNF